MHYIGCYIGTISEINVCVCDQIFDIQINSQYIYILPQIKTRCHNNNYIFEIDAHQNQSHCLFL